MEDVHQHFEKLGLRPSASLGEIKQAYRDLIMVWHPDRFPGNPRLQQLGEEKTKQINFAYQQLNSHWTEHGAGPKPPEQTSANAAGTNQHQGSSGTNPNSNYQREDPRQSRHDDSKTERARPDKSNYWIPETTGVLIVVFSCLSFCLLGFVEYGEFSPWKALSIELSVGISFLSLVKAKSDHPRLTIWNYLKTFATISLYVCLAIALLAAWLMKETNGRRRSKT